MKPILITFLFLLLLSVMLDAKKITMSSFIISDDLTYTALSCYGNKVCQTPTLTSLRRRCSLYPSILPGNLLRPVTGLLYVWLLSPCHRCALGYKSPRPQIGDRSTWSQHFRNHGYHAARVSKIYHMGVPGGIESGGDGADDSLSWDEKYNSKGPNGGHPVMEKPCKKTQTAKDPWLEVTHLSSSKQMETILCTRTGRPRKRPSSYLRNINPWKNLFGLG